MLFAASEAAPFAKTGGLGDVVAALPKALAARGHDIRVTMPLYREVDRRRWKLRQLPVSLAVRVGAPLLTGTVWEGALPGSSVPVYFINQPELFDREGLYQQRGADHPDNLARFSFFSQAALALPPAVGWRPQLLHAHDWQAALACAHLKLGASQDPLASVLTIHNLAYQGAFPKEQWPMTGLPDSAFTLEGLEFYGKVNCLKGGLLSADLLTTVSPTYATEIQSRAGGCALDDILRARTGDLTGILNGIDTDEWNPASDPHLAARYSSSALQGKAACKRALRQQQRLPDEPCLLIGMVQRLADQKGVDLFLDALEPLMALPLQVVLLGTGEPSYHARLEQASRRFPDRLAVNLTFDPALAHRIEAGADAFLMPSKFEPCGLNQMYSMRYGTVPIVRRVGGLADTVVDVGGAAADRPATGFAFEEHSARALLEAMQRALAAFDDRAAWRRLMRAGMQQDFSWAKSATEYVSIYRRALSRRATRVA